MNLTMLNLLNTLNLLTLTRVTGCLKMLAVWRMGGSRLLVPLLSAPRAPFIKSVLGCSRGLPGLFEFDDTFPAIKMVTIILTIIITIIVTITRAGHTCRSEDPGGEVEPGEVHGAAQHLGQGSISAGK